MIGSLIAIPVLLFIDQRRKPHKAILYILVFILFTSTGVWGITNFGLMFALFTPIFLAGFLLFNYLVNKEENRGETLDDSPE